MKKRSLSSALLAMLVATSSLLMISCEEEGDVTSDSYMMVGSTSYELKHGTFTLSTDDWGDGIARNWHDVAVYSDGLSILEDRWGYDSIVGDGALMGFSVHPLDSTSIVGDFTFTHDWTWDGTMATHGMPLIIKPDTSIYPGEMTEGSTVSISLEGDIFTIEVDGFTKEWGSTDSVAITVRYTGTLEEEESQW